MAEEASKPCAACGATPKKRHDFNYWVNAFFFTVALDCFPAWILAEKFGRSFGEALTACLAISSCAIIAIVADRRG